MNRFFVKYVKNIVPVSFNMEVADELVTIGEDKPQFTVKINKIPKKKDLMTSTSLALAEAYMKRDIEVDEDLFEVLNSFLGEMGKFTTNRKALKGLLNTSTSKRNQKNEVSSHYDIGNEFYKLWLDETMSYSCAYFKHRSDTLYQAQVNKVEHILQKLHIEPGMTLLDIGCGWGFLLMHAAKKYGVKGVGITLSKEQHTKFKEDIEKEGLQDVLEAKLMDYRELEKQDLKFDRIVSVGMLEHVGRENYELFMKNVKSSLKPGGLCLLHYISGMKELSGDPFMKKYIFPGGMLPSLREVVNLMGDEDMHCIDVESLRRHYTRTLLMWRDNFLDHKDEIEKAHGDEFTRMWELYLTSCAATFWNGIIDLHQILMSNGINNKIPMNRVV
ncbi:MAG: class I SAM-dependent methyltransferase [Aminipila sp.]